jgi:hypothetical protein
MGAERGLPIGTRAYPTSAWQPGEIIRQHYAVPLPPNPPTDLYITLRVRSQNMQSALPVSIASTTSVPLSAYPAPNDSPVWTPTRQDQFMLTAPHLNPIEHHFIAPLPLKLMEVRFGDLLALLGYDLTPSHGKLDVALYWRALNRSSINYKVFVHLLSDDGRVLAQHDSQPAYDLRPTSGWLNGEYVKDEHRINLNDQVSAGTYRLEVGVYEPSNGERLPSFVRGVEQPERRVILTTVLVP